MDPQHPGALCHGSDLGSVPPAPTSREGWTIEGLSVDNVGAARDTARLGIGELGAAQEGCGEQCEDPEEK